MGWRGELRAVAASPLMWGFACLCVATEILGYRLGDMVAATPVAAGNFSLFSVGRAGAVALALLLSMRMASLAVSRWSSVAILGAAAAGSLLMIGGRAVDGSSWWAEAGALLVVASSEFLWLILFELLASLSLRSLRATLALAALVNAALVPLFALEATAAAVAPRPNRNERRETVVGTSVRWVFSVVMVSSLFCRNGPGPPARTTRIIGKRKNPASTKRGGEALFRSPETNPSKMEGGLQTVAEQLDAIE